jgi:hypothetical protein
LQRVTTPFHSGWFAYSKGYIEQIPIKIPESTAEKKLATWVIESVHAIMGAKSKLQKDRLSDRDRTSLESEVESHEHRINEAVFKLYGVKELP